MSSRKKAGGGFWPNHRVDNIYYPNYNHLLRSIKNEFKKGSAAFNQYVDNNPLHYEPGGTPNQFED